MARFEWFEEGKQFVPEVYPEDMEEIENAEKELVANGKATLGAIARARCAFVGKILARSLPPEKRATYRLTVAQAAAAFDVLYTDALKVQEDDGAPLG